MRRLTPLNIALIAAGILILAFALWTAASTRRGNPDKLTDGNNAAAKAADPEKRCGAQPTYDLIKRDLFRRAAALRGSDQAAFDKAAAYSVVRIDRPLLDSEDDQTGAIACSGSLTLDLPPGLAVVGGRRTLTADIGYGLQRAADGNGEVLTLTRADSIITPLATLARAGGPVAEPLATPTANPLAPVAAEPLAPATNAPPSVRPSPPPPVVRPAPPPMPSRPRSEPVAPPAPPRVQSSARPSFNCANARTQGEVAVCRDSGLAALDRQMAAQFNSAMRNADPGTRAQLQGSRNRFLNFRDRCGSDACIADTYRGRMREIEDIAAGR